MSDTLRAIRELGIKAMEKLEKNIKANASKRQDYLSGIKKVEKQFEQGSQDMENIQTIKKYKEIYMCNKNNPDDKSFSEEYRP